MTMVGSSLKKAPFLKRFQFTLKCKAGLFKFYSSGLESVFAKFCFREGLGCTVDITVET